jgi:hypothetical protein
MAAELVVLGAEARAQISRDVELATDFMRLEF